LLQTEREGGLSLDLLAVSNVKEIDGRNVREKRWEIATGEI